MVDLHIRCQVDLVRVMKTKFLLLSVLAVSAGACTHSDELQGSTERYRNEPVNELVARLGPASNMSSTPDGSLWVWSTGESLTGSSLSCALRVRVADDQRVTATEWAGNAGACQRLSQQLQGQY